MGPAAASPLSCGNKTDLVEAVHKQHLTSQFKYEADSQDILDLQVKYLHQGLTQILTISKSLGGLQGCLCPVCGKHGEGG